MNSEGAADERFMRRALELAERGRGLTSPNPLVGAVVVTAGTVVGEGFHRRAGTVHAEIEALEAAQERAERATLYITLEPCVHHGRTPPCAPRVIAAGVRRVVVATEDPNPTVAGRGVATLRAAGIDVVVGPLAVDAARQNRVFFTAMRKRRPHITLKAAGTLDGKLTDTHGVSRWITGDEARCQAHRLRSEADAIVVGVGTVLADDPALTVRLDRPWPREPYRVVLDSAGRTPPDARLIGAGTPSRALIMIGPAAAAARAVALSAAGATVVEMPLQDDRVDLEAALRHLYAREVRAVLVEGGSEVHGAFVTARLVDRVAIFLAPVLLGGRAAASIVGGGGLDLGRAIRLEDLAVRRFGQDVLIEADTIDTE